MIKRLFDFFGSLIGLIVLSPVFVIVSILVKINSSGPIFFKQERYGKDGKIFKVIKFRTMKVGSENYSVEQLRNFESSGRDPRVSNFSKFLRKFALDEIPQLINILKGEMSFVGPRAYYLERYNNNPNLKQRLIVKPGLTCSAAVKGGVHLSEDELFKLDMEYISNNNFFLDISILLKSVFLVLSGKGF